MAATLVRKVQLRITADDGDTEAKLAQISAKADELAAKHPELKIRIDTAAAAAKLAVLRTELKNTSTASVDAKTRLGALGQALNSLTLGVSGGWGEMSMFGKVMAGLNVATGLGEPLMAGLTVAVGGLSSGLVAGGLGLGVFGLVAKSVYSQVSSAVKAFQTAQSTTGKASAAAMAQYNAYMAALPPGQRAVATSIIGAQNAWQNFVQANTGGVAKIMSQGIGLLPKVFQAMQPFLGPTEKALSGIIGQLGKGLGSSGFKSWIDAFAKASGPNLTNLSQAIGHIVVGIGGILKAFLPMATTMTGGLDKITGEFAKWGTTLSGHTGFQSLMSTFKSETPQAISTLKNLVAVIKNVVSGMTGLSTGSNSKMLLQVLGPLSGILAKLSKNQDLVRLALYLLAAADAGKKLKTAFTGIQAGMSVFKAGASAFQDFNAGFSNSAAAASDATGVWGTFGGKISSLGSALKNAGSAVASFVAQYAAKIGEAMAATGVWIAEHTAAAATFIAENVAEAAAATAAFIAENAATLGIVAGIALLVAGIVYLATHWKQVWADIKKWVGDAVSFIKAHWPLILTILTGPVGLAVKFITGHWTQIYNGAKSMIDKVVGFFKALPGRILSALGHLGTLLLDAGKDVVRGFIRGIESLFGDVAGAALNMVEKLGSKVLHALGIGSPSKVAHGWGLAVAQGMANGIDAGAARSAAAARRMAAGIGAAASPALAGAGAGGAGQRMQLEFVGNANDPLWKLFKENIRIRGGDPSVLGR